MPVKVRPPTAGATGLSPFMKLVAIAYVIGFASLALAAAAVVVGVPVALLLWAAGLIDLAGLFPGA